MEVIALIAVVWIGVGVATAVVVGRAVAHADRAVDIPDGDPADGAGPVITPTRIVEPRAIDAAEARDGDETSSGAVEPKER